MKLDQSYFDNKIAAKNKPRVGDLFSKKTGYTFNGVIVAVFETSSKKTRIVGENADGLLFIFNPNQIDIVTRVVSFEQ